MFENRSLRVQMVKTPKGGEGTETSASHISPEDLEKVVKDNADYIAKRVVAAYAAIKLIQTVSIVIVNAAPKR